MTCTIQRGPGPVGPWDHLRVTASTNPDPLARAHRPRVLSVDMRNLLSILGDADAEAVARSTEVRT